MGLMSSPGTPAAGDFKLHRSLRGDLVAGPLGAWALRPCKERRRASVGPGDRDGVQQQRCAGRGSDGLGREGLRLTAPHGRVTDPRASRPRPNGG